MSCFLRCVVSAVLQSNGCRGWVLPSSVSTSYRKAQHRRGRLHLRSALVNGTDTGPTTTLPVSLHEEPQASLAAQVRSVNYFISRKCNYACKFCFHTQKATDMLDLEAATRGLEMLRMAGTEKINFAGGEPFLHPHFLGQLCQRAHELGLAVSIISNGSLITREWMERYGYYVDVLGVSIDSFDATTNSKIGRGDPSHAAAAQHVQRIMNVREWCTQQHIKFKVNTVVCSLNHQEDMTEHMLQLDPTRWKVFQVLVLHGENAGGMDLRNALPLIISDQQYQDFVDRHAPAFPGVLIPESNNVMQNSYLLLDEQMRFLDCSTGSKIPSTDSILTVGVEAALQQAGFDFDMFQQRGGVFDWSRDRESSSPFRSNNDGFGIELRP